MSINRTKLDFDRGFVRAPNDWVRDARLSRRARGLLVELLSHSIGWKVTVSSLVASGTEGAAAVRSMIAELKEAGYLKVERERDSKGIFGGVNYTLSDPHESNKKEPNPFDPPTLDGPALDSTNMEKSTLKEEQAFKEDHELPEQQTFMPAKTETGLAAADVSVKVPPAEAGTKRGHRLPADFSVTPAMVEWARERVPAVDGAFQTEQFVDHWTAASGASASKRDWVAAWRLWMRNAQERAGQRPQRASLEDKVRSTRDSGRRLQAMADEAQQRLEIGS